MADEGLLSTFPTYGELTQTKGWSGGGSPPVGTIIEVDLEKTGSSRYDELAVLGSGGMGKVVLARDVRVGRDVALKVLHPEHEIDPAERVRFLREAQVQGQLEHPSIVPVYDIDHREDGKTFFTMRRIIGKTLAAILDELRGDAPEARERYTQRVVLQAFATVCLTVDYAHERNVIHRDLKPANIMLGDYGEVYVLDWGLARIFDPEVVIEEAPRLSSPGAMMGTPLYMAPEQMADPDVDATADVYALGLILFEILTLQRCRDPAALYVPVDARLSVRAPQLDPAPELEAICVTATEPEPADRFPSARALHDAVARYLEGDRDREQRQTVAAEHAERAREALSRADHGGDHEQEAVQHLLRALALDPTNREHVVTLAEVIGSPPRTKPPEIEREIEDAAQALIRVGARYGALAMASWFLFLPFLIALGIRRMDYLIATAIPLLLTVIAAYRSACRRHNGHLSQCVGMLLMVSGTMMLSRIFGPLILIPTIFTSWAIVAQTYPYAFLRWFALVTSTCGIALPLVLEVAGVLPSSYVIEDGRFEIVPQLTGFARGPALAFLGIASVGVVLVPALFVARLRTDLARSQEREMLQNWKLRRMRDDILRAKSQPS